MENLEMNNHSFWHKRKVLITGHTGFKGSWLSLWLEKLGAEITGISLEPATQPALFNQLKIKEKISRNIYQDIRDTENLRKTIKEFEPEIVFHLAAQPLVIESYRNPIDTWETNVMGSLNLLESLRNIKKKCSVVMITTDKVYKNMDWEFGYRETDQLGGHDPYSASKAAAEIAIESWRLSFCGNKTGQNPFLQIATARAGNVIGGGDWARDRIIPDTIRALTKDEIVKIRNPKSRRPWQHVLEPLNGYLVLAQKLHGCSEFNQSKLSTNPLATSFNFGPNLESNKTVEELVNEILKNWPGKLEKVNEIYARHESSKLNLQIDKAYHYLGWQPKWDFETSVKRTINWYKEIENNEFLAEHYSYQDIEVFENS